MKTIKIWNDSPSERQLQEITEEIKAGKLAIIPTDTLYAICCDALNIKAIERVCKLKGINPEKTNLSIICSDISMAAQYARIDNEAFRILKENTPGPFTFIFRAASSLPKAFKGRKMVGVRIPDLELPRLLAQYLENPLLSTSIEFDDDDQAREPGLIADRYAGSIDTFVEGEEGGSIPSTIVDLSDGEPQIIREGKGELR